MKEGFGRNDVKADVKANKRTFSPGRMTAGSKEDFLYSGRPLSANRWMPAGYEVPRVGTQAPIHVTGPPLSR